MNREERGEGDLKDKREEEDKGKSVSSFITRIELTAISTDRAYNGPVKGKTPTG